jgi:hypothetical protein
MTDMREKVARALEAVQVHVGGHEIYVARDAALTPEEIAAFAQAAITALWPLAMEEAAKVTDEAGCSLDSNDHIAAAIAAGAHKENEHVAED